MTNVCQSENSRDHEDADQGEQQPYASSNAAHYAISQAVKFKDGLWISILIKKHINVSGNRISIVVKHKGTPRVTHEGRVAKPHPSSGNLVKCNVQSTKIETDSYI